MRKTRQLVIVGAGGFARELALVVTAARSAGSRWETVGFVVSERAAAGDDPVLGDFAWLADNLERLDGLALGIGTPEARARLGMELRTRFPRLDWPTLLHPSVMIDRSTASLGSGVVVCAGTIGTVNVEIGEFTMVNLACTLGHESRIGSACVLNPGVNVSGDVTIGDQVLVGTGAQILQNITIGDRAIVGAGAVVIKDVPPDTTVVGVPARPVQR